VFVIKQQRLRKAGARTVIRRAGQPVALTPPQTLA
jgi:hypothetical protein